MDKVLDKNKNALNAHYKILSIDHQVGFVLESKGDRGRNSDYNQALEILLERLQKSNVKSIRVKIVSEDLVKHFQDPLKRTLEIDGSTNILIKNQEILSIRRKIGRAMTGIKVDKSTKGGNPTKRIQLISSGLSEKEWSFLAIGNSLSNKNSYGEIFDSQEFENQVEEYLDKPLDIIPKGNRNPRKIERSSPEVIERDPHVKAWVLKNASGICENCGNESPFVKNNGKPYLEVHHLKQLSKKGSDTVENAIALCPNCHREFHFGVNRDNLLKNIYNQIPRLIKE